jgi:leader peptidase (prepilin peptidase)/N-methyltransferase
MTIAFLVFLLGLCVGSFTNVLIFRLPDSESVVRPASRCRSCARALAWYENIPLASFLALRGRCRTCGTGISLQYPLVELAVALIFAGNFLLFSRTADPASSLVEVALGEPEWIRGAIFMTILLAIAVTDLRTYIIPDELSLGGMLLGIALSFLPEGVSPVDSIVGAVAGGGLLLVVAWVGSAVFRKEAMGGGDIKMLAMIGAFVGWQGVLLTLFLGALLGSVVYGPFVLYQRLRQGRTAGAGNGSAGAAARAPEAVSRAYEDPARGGGGEPSSGGRVVGHAKAPDLSEEASGGREQNERKRGLMEESNEVESGRDGMEERVDDAVNDAVKEEVNEAVDEEVDRGLVPFGFFLAPAAALTFYLAEELVRGYLKLVGLSA